MKHKPFETWILDNPALTKAEQRLLEMHLKECPQCQTLQQAWQDSRGLLMSATTHKPAPEFSRRWKSMLTKRREKENARQTRRTLLILLVLMGMGSLAYILQNNLLVIWLVTAFNLLASLIISITKVLAGIGEFLGEGPEVLYGFGFFTLGALVAFITTLTFVLWNVLKKEGASHAQFTEE